jgi:hypothetical protein
METTKSKIPKHYSQRLLLGVAEPIRFPHHAFRGKFIPSAPVRMPPPENAWTTKKTRGLLVFFFTSHSAAAEHRERRKQRRAMERREEVVELPPTSHVYIPLDPLKHVWMSIDVRQGMTHEEAIAEALWSPITAEAAAILDWFLCFLDDEVRSLDLTMPMPTQRFARDFLVYSDAYEASPESAKLPNGLLRSYIGDLLNDGTLDTTRHPEHSELPCYV